MIVRTAQRSLASMSSASASLPAAKKTKTSSTITSFFGRVADPNSSVAPDVERFTVITDHPATLVQVFSKKWTQLLEANKNQTLPLLGFDLDDTLIHSKSPNKHVFYKTASDWAWHTSFPGLVTRLRKEFDKYDRKLLLVIFTNQAGVPKQVPMKQLIGRLQAIISSLDLPVLALAAIEKNRFRKPDIGMFQHLESILEECQIKIDRSSSLFVGDAAGRPAMWKYGSKKDHASSDRSFAHNIMIPFKTPDEYFLSEIPAEFECFDPSLVLSKSREAKDLARIERASSISDEPEVVLFVGWPGAGKTKFFKDKFEDHGYVHINQDLMKSAARCRKEAEKAIHCGHSICIDTTNPRNSTRSEWVSLAAKLDVPIRAVYFDTSRALAQHLNAMRSRISEYQTPKIPDVAYATYNKNFVPPSVAEGFTRVDVVPFVPVFSTDSDKAAFLHRNV